MQGILAIGFGLAAMSWPGITTLVLAYLFAAFMLLDGAVLMLLGLTAKRRGAATRAWWGLAQLLLGLYVVYKPTITVGVLIILLGWTLMVRGAFNLLHALWWTHEPFRERTTHGIMGLAGLIIGVVVAAQPTAGGLAFVWVLGLYAAATGSALLTLALHSGGGTHRQGTH